MARSFTLCLEHRISPSWLVLLVLKQLSILRLRSLQGYLAAMSASSYSLVSIVQRFGPRVNPMPQALNLALDFWVGLLVRRRKRTSWRVLRSLQGYLAAMSASSYSMVSMVQRFGPLMNPGGAAISLTYNASNLTIPGYGGGMSSAKAVGARGEEGVEHMR